jgi:Sec-independent protein secretion pathway component TatC
MTTATASPGVMPLTGHAREARNRAFRAAVALVLGMIAGFILSEQILEVLRAPIEQIAQSRNASLNYDSVTGAFDLRLKIALFSGVCCRARSGSTSCSPSSLRGSRAGRGRYAFGYAATAIVLFAGGCVFGLLLFPHMVELLTGFASDQDSTILNASYYVDFVLKVLLATGIAFVLPVLS